MKRLAVLGILMLFWATDLAAQRGGMRGGFGGGRGGFVGVGRGGFGYRGFVGGFGHRGLVGGFGHRGFGGFGHRGFVGRFGHRGFVGGFGFGGGIWSQRKFAFHGGFYSPYVYSWPVYVGGAYSAGYFDPFYEAFPSPAVTVVNPYQAAPSPPVVISQNYAPQPQVYEAQPRAAREPDSSSPILYLIAFRDGVIRAALAYWVEGNELRYLDVDKKQQSVPLDRVDRDLSMQLNRERRVPFRLP